MQALLERVIKRTLVLYQKSIGQDEVCLDPDEQGLVQAMAEALRAPIASPPGTHLAPAPDEPQPQAELCRRRNGFSLHAARALEAHDREGLERLLRYGARAPIAASRLSIDEGGRVVYELTKPWGVTRATVLRLSPSDFLRRLAMLIPPPYQRSREKVQQAPSTSRLGGYHRTKAQLKFSLRSSGPIVVVRKILDHLKIPTDVSPAPLAHGPWPWHSQTVLDVLEPGPEGDRDAYASYASASSARPETSFGKARGPPSR